MSLMIWEKSVKNIKFMACVYGWRLSHSSLKCSAAIFYTMGLFIINNWNRVVLVPSKNEQLLSGEMGGCSKNLKVLYSLL